MRFLMCQLSEREKEMMRKLGKLSSVVVLGCLLCLALGSTGAFAQSAGSYMATSATQGVTAYAWHAGTGTQQAARRSEWGNGWFGDGYAQHHGSSYGRTVRYVRVMRTIHVTRIVRVTKIRVIRVTKTLRISSLIRQVRFRRIASCGYDC